MSIINKHIGGGESLSLSKKIAIFAVFLFAIIISIFIGYKFIIHELSQKEQIEILHQKVNHLSARIEKIENVNLKVDWSDKEFNYFAIGNSITLHAINSYWWAERGMAASKDEKDYVHIVANHLKAKVHAYNFSIWEVSSKDRCEFLSLLDNYLDPRIDLITIQLGENANDLSTWKNDWIDLINYIKTKNEKAKIVIVGDFWSFPKRDEGKIEAAKQCGVIFIDLSDIKENKTYQSCMNCTVIDDEGKAHQITHNGVAAHPGDLGMKEIAMRIISSI